MNSKSLLARVLLGLLPIAAGCGGAQTSKSASCPAAGTEVPLGKLQNSSFAPDFVGCEVRTQAKFQGASCPGFDAFVNTPETVVFLVTNDGAVKPQCVRTSKASADLIFAAKPGDPLVIAGALQPIGPWPDTYFMDAASVTKAQ